VGGVLIKEHKSGVRWGSKNKSIYKIKIKFLGKSIKIPLTCVEISKAYSKDQETRNELG
jgi:hypothetical protein